MCKYHNMPSIRLDCTEHLNGRECWDLFASFKSNETPLISIERVQFSCFECVCLLKQFSVAPAGTGEYSTKKRKKIGSLRIKELGNKSVWHFPGTFLLLKNAIFL